MSINVLSVILLSTSDLFGAGVFRTPVRFPSAWQPSKQGPHKAVLRCPMPGTIFVAFVLGLLCSAACASTQEAPASPTSAPNILLIIADDLGYADLGYMGSRIQTPNIDALANSGVVFSRFHASPMCAPTRAMLYSGNNNHIAGMGRQFPNEFMRSKVPGFEEQLSDRVAPFPRLLQDAGYRTYIAGKWHLGNSVESSPVRAGFDRSFVLTNGAANHWDETGFSEAGSTYREDGEVVTYPSGRYSTTLYTEKLLEYIESGRQEAAPFLAVAAYTSPHWPLQLPDGEADLYAGQFDAGYDRLREDNIETLKALGYIPETAAAPERPDEYPLWIDLSAEQRRKESRKMELYAAMVDNLDRHVGKLLDYLQSEGLRENTLVIFMSDNGAASADFYNRGPYVTFVREHYDNSLANMGRPTSFVSYGQPWAEASSAPFRRHKWYTTQGGMVSPMLMHGAMLKRRGVSADYVTVMDIAPTLLEFAGASYPEAKGLRPMLGASMVDFLHNKEDTVHGPDHETVLFHRGYGMARKGRWKIVSQVKPFDESVLELYDVVDDPGETRNLRDSEPEMFEELLQLWRSKRLEYGVILPEDL